MEIDKVVFILLPVAFTLFGFAWTVGFTIFVLWRRSFLKRALVTTGTVIHVAVRHSPMSVGSARLPHHYPTVRFQTADGRVLDCRINVSLQELYQVGQSVIVNYNAQNPCKSTQLGDRESQPIGKYILFIGVGAIILSIGLIMSVFTFL